MNGDGTVDRLASRLQLGQIALGMFQNSERKGYW
jgi:hypothetical protein